MSRLTILNEPYLTNPRDENVICAIGCRVQEEVRCDLCVWGYSSGERWDTRTVCDQTEPHLDTPQTIHNITESLSYV